ncbi:unnamed protein product, partial [Urochloa humidicola]
MVRNRGLSSSVLLLLAFLFVHGAPSSSRAADTIADGQPLYGGQSLVSKRGKFKLGFFQPDSTLADEDRELIPAGGEGQDEGELHAAQVNQDPNQVSE